MVNAADSKLCAICILCDLQECQIVEMDAVGHTRLIMFTCHNSDSLHYWNNEGR